MKSTYWYSTALLFLQQNFEILAHHKAQTPFNPKQ